MQRSRKHASVKTNKYLNVSCHYFVWTLRSRDSVWQADGRSNQLSAGRHSLNTRDFEEAKDILHDFNLQVAVNLELASRRLLDSQSGKILSIKSGLEWFMAVAPEME